MFIDLFILVLAIITMDKEETDLNAVKLIKGHLFALFTTKEWLEAATTFKARDTDVFVASFPKSGTHWLAYIVYLLIHKERISKAFMYNHVYMFDIPQVETFPPYMEGKVTFKDLKVLKSTVEKFPDPRIFISHFPQEYLPQNPKSKFLYIYRNPKDTVISAYRYCTNVKFAPYQGTFEEFFQIYIESNCFNFCKQFRGYMKHKDEPNYFIVSYEELKRNFSTKLQEIAIFLGIELTDKLHELIIRETNFESMKGNALITHNYMKAGETFFPRGAVGTWQSILTKEQSDKIDSIILSELGEDFLKIFPYLVRSKL